MSSYNRRWVLGAFIALPSCGFAPAYGPQGGGDAVQGRFALPDPDSSAEFLLLQRVEERLGRPAPGAFVLTPKLTVRSEGLGTSEDGRNTRVQLVGTLRYSLTQPGAVAGFTSGETRAFVGYSTTGSTVATQAARRDAEARLMTILADQLVDQLILMAPDLPR